MYSTIAELPTEVKNSFDDDDCETWLKIYNEQDPKTDEQIKQAKEIAWNACKTLPSSFSFDIIASVEDVDSDGELITVKSLSDQMDKYIEQGGTVMSEHGDYRTGHIWGWDEYTDPDTGYPGVIVHGNVFGGRSENSEYAQARQDFLDGKNNLSIAGDASVEGYECDGARCFTRRNITQLMEISLVSNPANPYAKLQWFNDKAVVKSKDDINLKVSNVGIHKSYNECDLERMRKILKGQDCKVTKNGLVVVIPKDVKKPARFVNLIKSKIKTFGQVISVSTDSVTIDTNKRILEREFKKSYADGECNDEGILTDKVGRGRFYELYNRGLIKNTDKGFGFDGTILSQEIREGKARRVRKARFTFKLDFSSATMGTPAQTSEGYDVPVSNYSILCKNEVIATNQTGTLSISLTDLSDSDFVDELYEKEYKARIDDAWDAWEKEHENDPDYGTNEEIFSQEMHRVNLELDEMYDSDRIQYSLQSVLSYPNVSFKGSNDEWGAELDDEYADELKHNIQVAIKIGDSIYTTKVKTEYSAFIPSDEAENEMVSFMETEE